MLGDEERRNGEKNEKRDKAKEERTRRRKQEYKETDDEKERGSYEGDLGSDKDEVLICYVHVV